MTEFIHHHEEAEPANPETVRVELIPSFAVPFLKQRNLLEAQLEKAMIDPLTGMRNRLAFETEYPGIFERSRPGRLAVVFVDIANLKPFNDNYGHREGDKLFSVIANALKRSTRSNDIWYRVGGDEMIGLIDGAQSDFELPFRDEALVVVSRVKQNTKDDIAKADFPEGVFTGVGVGQAVKDAYSKPDELIDLADSRMEADKRQLYKDAGIERRS